MVPPTIVGPVKEHTATIIFAHGLGDSAEGWVPWAESIKHVFPGIKFVLLSAPTMRVTVAQGSMPAWFDVKVRNNLDPAMEDQVGMMRAASGIQDLVEEEVASGLSEDRIVVGGFSQGCVISILAGLTSKRKIAGVLGLSGFLGKADSIVPLITPEGKSLKYYWGHGDKDAMVTLSRAQGGVTQLQELGVDVIYRGMGHTLGAEESQDVVRWMKEMLP